jgi:transposase-like protein
MPRAKPHTSSAKRQRWTPEYARATLEKQASSGLTAREFAERERIEPSRLYYWRERLGVTTGTGHQLAASAASVPERAAFVEVRSHRPSRIELVLRTGHVLFVPDSFDASALGRLVEILERATEC